jgi:hypothetical protein
MKPDWSGEAARIPPAVFRRYLATSGWHEDELPATKSFWRYSREIDTGRVSVEIPKRQDFVDYDRRATEVVLVLVEVEQRPAHMVLFGLDHPTADMLTFGYTGPDLDGGLLALDDAIRFREARRRLLLAAAHSVLEPLVHHPRLSKAEPVRFLSTCREVPARPGSYLSPVLVPVSSAIGPLDLEDPFPRQVTKLLATALSHTADLLGAGDDQRLLEGSRLGLSANFLAALHDLRPPTLRGTMSIRFAWAARRPAPSASPVVAFDGSLFEPLGEIARVLRESSPSPGTEVEGYVVGFTRTDHDPQQPGEVAIVADIDDGPRSSKIHVTLDPVAYRHAWDAHTDGHRVRITGTLTKERRRYVLRNPGDLIVVPEE